MVLYYHLQSVKINIYLQNVNIKGEENDTANF
jgi:hypothetical protein